MMRKTLHRKRLVKMFDDVRSHIPQANWFSLLPLERLAELRLPPGAA